MIYSGFLASRTRKSKGAKVKTPIFELKNGRWFLYEDFTYRYDLSEITIKKGTRTNLASIPQFLEWLISSDDKDIILAALVYDALVGEFVDPVPMKIGRILRYPTWNQSAEILRNIMKQEGAKYWKHTLVYYAVVFHGLIKKRNSYD